MSKNSREIILEKIQAALKKNTSKKEAKPNFSKNLYTASSEHATVRFAEKLTQAQGLFFYCENRDVFHHQFKEFIKTKNSQYLSVWEDKIRELLPSINLPYLDKKHDLHRTEIGITGCECLISRLGSIILSSKQGSGRSLSIFPPIHIVIAFASQLVEDIQDGLELVKKKYATLPSMICLTTGPSRTADIEKTLVLGAHGPKELVVFLLDDTL